MMFEWIIVIIFTCVLGVAVLYSDQTHNPALYLQHWPEVMLILAGLFVLFLVMMWLGSILMWPEKHGPPSDRRKGEIKPTKGGFVYTVNGQDVKFMRDKWKLKKWVEDNHYHVVNARQLDHMTPYRDK